MSAESAQELAAAGIDPKQLDGMLRQLNGSIEMVNQAQMSQTTGQTMQGGSAQADRSRSQNALGGKLSGAEFLSTLGTVQPNGAQAHGKQQGFGGFDGRNPQGGESAQGELAGRIGRADKAELQLIQGGAKPKKFGESPTAERAMSMETPMVAAGTRLESAQPAPTVQVTGHVTSGNMAQDRLSTESLMGMSTGIRGLSNQGGGEMHVRLKPDNLGELHLKVVTQGNSVGLQIQASDEKARKIIEESMSHLKDSLSSQSLNLAQVDVSVAQPTSSGHSAEMNYQESRQQNAGYGDFGGMNQNTNHSQGDSGSQQRNELPAARSVGLNSNAIRGTAVGSTGSSRAQSASDGRLDVMA
jgi:flagellar hook-length control protein FliK